MDQLSRDGLSSLVRYRTARASCETSCRLIRGALCSSGVSCPQPLPAPPTLERLGRWGLRSGCLASPAALQPRTDSLALGRADSAELRTAVLSLPRGSFW